MSPEQLSLAAATVFGASLILAALVRALDASLPDRFIRERHDLALATLLLIPVVFALTFLPGQGIDTASAPRQIITPETASATAPWLNEVETRSVTTLQREPATALSIPWTLLALSIWAIGTLASLAVLATRLVRLDQLRKSARPIDRPHGLRLSRPIEIREHDDIGSPMLVGYVRPQIIVPTGFAFGTTARPVLEHEVAHAARGDSWITLSLHLLSAAFWWNLPQMLITPLYYKARESLCDTRAAIITGEPETLAQALVDTAVEASARRSPELAAAAHGMDLKARVRRLMSPSGAIERSPVATMAFILPVMVTSAVLATPALGTAQPENTDRSASEWVSNWTGNRDNDDDTLYGAAVRGDLDDIEARIGAGADPSKALNGDGTPLMGAIRGEHDDVFAALLAMGVDVNRTSDGDGSALIVAAKQGRADYVEALLSAGADPDLGVDGDGAALISAAMRGHIELIDLLVAAGADPNLAVPGDGNALIGAALHGEMVAAQRLLDAGANPNGYVYRDETPLIAAAQQGELEMAKLLVAAGADVSLTVKTPHRDPGGPYRSPLSEAERNGHDDVARWLKEMGAEHRPED
ncbi:MAG: ankyrin repeat domain-containing protein [Pseudomonadota bacterium]